MEVNYHGTDQWVLAKLVAEGDKDGTVNVMYEDNGEIEYCVPYRRIRPVMVAKSNTSYQASAKSSSHHHHQQQKPQHQQQQHHNTRQHHHSQHKDNDQKDNIIVEVNYGGSGEWLRAKLLGEGIDGTVDVRYEHNDEVEYDIPLHHFRPLKKQHHPVKVFKSKSSGSNSNLNKNKKTHTHSSTRSNRVIHKAITIEVNYDGQDRWVRAKLLGEGPNGTVDVMYEDNDEIEYGVLMQNIRSVKVMKKNKANKYNNSSSSSKEAKTKLSTRRGYNQAITIEVNYDGQDRWVRAKLIGEGPNGTVDVMYEDNDEIEYGVAIKYIRPVKNKVESRNNVDRKTNNNIIIEVNYEGSGRWRRAELLGEGKAGRVDVRYEDNDEIGYGVAIKYIRPVKNKVESRNNVDRKTNNNIIIEVNYRGSGRWRRAELLGEGRAGTVDVRYEDNDEIDKGIPLHYIRPIKTIKPYPPSSSLKRNIRMANRCYTPHDLEKAITIEVKYDGQDDRWVRAKLLGEGPNETVDVMYEDSRDIDYNIPIKFIRPVKSSAASKKTFKKSTKNITSDELMKKDIFIEVNIDDNGKWKIAKLLSEGKNDTVNVMYDDDKEEYSVPIKNIRPLLVQNKKITKNENKIKFTIGTKVLCNFETTGRFYPGVIKSINSDGSYEIDYDDGDYETNVTINNIKLLIDNEDDDNDNADDVDTDDDSKTYNSIKDDDQDNDNDDQDHVANQDVINVQEILKRNKAEVVDNDDDNNNFDNDINGVDKDSEVNINFNDLDDPINNDDRNKAYKRLSQQFTKIEIDDNCLNSIHKNDEGNNKNSETVGDNDDNYDGVDEDDDEGNAERRSQAYNRLSKEYGTTDDDNNDNDKNIDDNVCDNDDDDKERIAIQSNNGDDKNNYYDDNHNDDDDFVSSQMQSINKKREVYKRLSKEFSRIKIDGDDEEEENNNGDEDTTNSLIIANLHLKYGGDHYHNDGDDNTALLSLLNDDDDDDVNYIVDREDTVIDGDDTICS